MNVSKNEIAIIEQEEEFRSHPYLDTGKVPTIGYGSTYYEDGTHVQMTDPPITQERAADLMMHKLQQEFVPGVLKLVTVPLTQNQFDALIDFAYNAGLGNLHTSTLLRKLNAKDYEGASNEFAHWCHDDGKVLDDLVKRREAERKLFVS